MSKGSTAQSKLPGMPGKPEAAIKSQERVIQALFAVHEALEPTLEMMPPEARLTFKKKIKGDLIQVTVQPKGEE